VGVAGDGKEKNDSEQQVFLVSLHGG